MSSDLMDTSPGGEGDQYESIQTVTKPHTKDSGQLGAKETQTDAILSQEEQQKSERGDKTSENTRYGEAISEHGFGGETTTSSGEAKQEGLGSISAQIDGGDAAQSRREQGYGGGSGVGA